MPLRIGVVGLGLIAQVVHLPNLVRLSDRFAITHISDLSETVMRSIVAGLPGSPRCSTDAMALIADPDVDAVLLLTPGAHAPLALAALEAGKHVIAEKPLCVTQAEATQLEELAAARGLTLMVGYMKAYDPAMDAARSALAETGDVRLVSVEVRHPTDELQIADLDYVTGRDADVQVIRAAEAAEQERAREALGDVPVGLRDLYLGVLLGSVVHELSALRALGFEAPTRWAHVGAWPFDPAATGVEPPSLAATAALDGGSLLRLQWLWLPDYPRYEETITIVGTSGALQLDMPQPYGPNVAARLRVRGPAGSFVEANDGRQFRGSGFLEELRVFHEAVVADGPVPTGASEARADTASLQAFMATLAAELGSSVGGEAARVPGA